jgi:hypothetical protein
MSCMVLIEQKLAKVDNEKFLRGNLIKHLQTSVIAIAGVFRLPQTYHVRREPVRREPVGLPSLFKWVAARSTLRSHVSYLTTPPFTFYRV